VLLLAGAIAGGLLFSPPSPEATREAAKRVLGKAEYQTALPTDRPPTGRPGDEGTPEGRRRRERVGDRVPADWDGPRPPRAVPDEAPRGGGGSAVGQAVMWTLIGVVLVLVVLALLRSVRGSERDVAPGAVVAATPADAAVVARPLSAAEVLARDGRFGEAIHELLLQTLGALAARSSIPITASLTSREILARAPLPGAARGSLETLVGAAEVCHFGGRPASDADYARCTDHFRRFAAAYARADA
jgi:hypothetical protein